MRVIDRDLIREGHYGQRSCEPHLKAEHMAAPTNAACVKKVLANPEPSTHGVPAQAVDATQALNRSAGVWKRKVLRGRSLSCRATLLSCACVYTDRSVPLGKYCRSRPLVFSLDPRCHGLCGSQK